MSYYGVRTRQPASAELHSRLPGVVELLELAIRPMSRVQAAEAESSSLPPPGLRVFPDLLREGGEVRGFALQLRGLLG